jgi:pSer/pThr/pTyr-binding forkhead associated (FHA) protein
MQPHLLSELASIGLGDAEAFLVLEPTPLLPADPRQPTTVPPRPRAGAPAEPWAWALRRPLRRSHLVLGRAPDCDLVLDEATLSQCHLVLLAHRDTWLVQDAASTNGTRLDGAPLLQARAYRLRDGACLEAGQVRFTFHEPAGLAARLRRCA